ALFRAGAATLADVETACGDESPAVRRRAAEVTAAGPEELRSPILRLLDDTDPAVLEAAAWAAGECDPCLPGSVERLGQLAVGHDDALVREAAVAALGAIGDDRGLPAILAATTDKPAVRRRAVIALAPFAGPEVDAALERASTDRDRQVRQAAEDLLR
ncbi:MAG: HEAT repeat domain-containing protein, partial [Acidimicrobiales bacterium]